MTQPIANETSFDPIRRLHALSETVDLASATSALANAKIFAAQNEDVRRDAEKSTARDIYNDVRPPATTAPSVRDRRHTAARDVALQEWEGLVLDITAHEFSARLFDMTREGSNEERATFPIGLVTEDDRALLVPGAIFRWVIGLSKQGRERTVKSHLIFRRLPDRSSASLKRAVRIGEELATYFKSASADPKG